MKFDTIKGAFGWAFTCLCQKPITQPKEIGYHLKPQPKAAFV
jgi:hypothetical protein